VTVLTLGLSSQVETAWRPNVPIECSPVSAAAEYRVTMRPLSPSQLLRRSAPPSLPAEHPQSRALLYLRDSHHIMKWAYTS